VENGGTQRFAKQGLEVARARGGAHRLGGRVRWARLMRALLGSVWPWLAGYLVVRVWQLARSTVVVFPDSSTYRRPTDGYTLEWISLAGAAPRLWGTPLFFALFPNDEWRIVGQWAVSTVAWGFLAVALWSFLRTTAGRIVLMGTILMLALAPPVAGWDFIMLSESLSISLGVLAFALFLWWRRTGSRTALAVMTVVGLWWTFTRFEMALLLFVLAVAVIWHSRRPAAVVAVLAMLGTLAWATFANSAIDRPGWGGPFSAGGGPSEELMVYRLGRSVYLDPTLERIFAEQLGMPSCPGLADQARLKWDVVEIPTEYKKCPALQEWARANASAIGFRFAWAAPMTFARTTAPMFEVSMYGASANKAAAPPPFKQLNRILYPRPQPARIFLPVMTILLLVSAIGLGGLRRHRMLTVTALVLVGVALLSELAMLSVAVAELPRLGTQESTMFRLGLLLLLAIAVDLLAEFRTGARRPHADALSPPSAVATVRSSSETANRTAVSRYASFVSP